MVSPVKGHRQAKGTPDGGLITSSNEAAGPTFAATAAPVAGLAFAAPAVRRSGAHDEDPLGGKDIHPAMASLLRSRSGRGIALPGELAASMGEALGTDLSGVSLHVDPQADQIARSLQATAFTQGRDVYFSSDSYSPSSSSGKRLLAHELAHVAQGVHGSAGRPGTIGRADDPAEREADAAADKVLRTLRRQATVTRS